MAVARAFLVMLVPLFAGDRAIAIGVVSVFAFAGAGHAAIREIEAALLSLDLAPDTL
jgi:hypothetical protein